MLPQQLGGVAVCRPMFGRAAAVVLGFRTSGTNHPARPVQVCRDAAIAYMYLFAVYTNHLPYQGAAATLRGETRINHCLVTAACLLRF